MGEKSTSSWLSDYTAGVPQRHREDTRDSFRLLLALLVPPAAVAHRFGFGGRFWLSILLTLLFYIPGAIHAVFLVLPRGPEEAGRARHG